MVALENRDIRQRDLVPPPLLAQYHSVVISVGAIGRQVAVQLAAMGAPVLTLIDDDVVAVENLAVPGYAPAELGLAKVEAAAQACRHQNPDTLVEPLMRRFARSFRISPQRERLAVFACVDSIQGRRTVWDALHAQAAFFADGRMAGEVLRVLASTDPPVDSYYPSTLFEAAQAHPAPCTGRSTLYAASIAAGLMLARFAMHLRGHHAVPRDTLLNLAADELTSL